MDITRGLNVDSDMKVNSRAVPTPLVPEPHAINERDIPSGKVTGYDPLPPRASEMDD
jgi:hypothetical protein